MKGKLLHQVYLRCNRCEQSFEHTRTGYKPSYCPACKKLIKQEYQRQYYKQHADKMKQSAHEYYHNIKRAATSYFSEQ